ncbi:hypothetical protein C8Q75DRAFT_801916 [Abortiporus biennis]|nr:hypothetical protein C8Q75DRAFT_801916 [Abortiporus biennis]
MEKFPHDMPPTSTATVSTAADSHQTNPFKDHLSHAHPYHAAEPPPLNYTIRTRRRISYISIFFSLIFIETCILPLILFYSLRWGAHLSTTKNLAIITSLVGTISGAKVGQRCYYLWFRTGHESRRPIGSGRWGVDFFQILLSTGLTAFFIPLIIGSSLSPASVPTVAMALPCFMLTVCIPMLISGLFPRHFRLPVRISSFQPYYLLPPLTYTIVEDVIAVDGGGGLEFRQAWRHRYEESRVMRKLLRDIALMWGISGIAVAGALIAIAWTTSDDVGYGLGYGMAWLWAIFFTCVTFWWVEKELHREKTEWEDVVRVHREKHLNLVETDIDRDIYKMVLERRSFSRPRRDRDMVELSRCNSAPDPTSPVVEAQPPSNIMASDAISV